MDSTRFTLGTAIAVLPFLLLGCSRRVHPPKIDPVEAGAAAIEQYDSDGDGSIRGQELEAVPGLKNARGAYDSDGDGGVSAQEITDRIQAWQERRIGLAPAYACTVLLNGRPLKGATILFDPEEYLGGALVAARGMTDDQGVAFVEIPQNNLPEGQDGLHGTQVGVYKVRITHTEESIPPRYNTGTELGIEISNDTIIAQTDESNMVFKLKAP